MKNTGLAAPYVVWMAIFVVAPRILVAVFAVTDKAGGLTLANFSNMATYIPAFQHSCVLAIAAPLILWPGPPPAVTSILAETYGGDTQFASEAVFLSSLLCLVTIPLISLLL